VVFLPTCSSPTSSARRFARTTPASSSVSQTFSNPCQSYRYLTIFTGDVGKLLGEKWKSLNEKQKTPYEAKAAADKKRYEEEKAAYTAVSCNEHSSSLDHQTDSIHQGGDAEEEEEEE